MRTVSEKLKRSPIKARPLRDAGESLDEMIRRKVDDYTTTWLLLPFFLIAYAVMEWYRWYTDIGLNPVAYTVVAVVGTVLAVPNIIRGRRFLARLRLGLEGERAVGQYLERMRSQGAEVYHDIPGPGFNIDHVIIAGSGIYAIETKTYSKPLRGSAVVSYNGSSLAINDGSRTDAPIAQAKAGAKWLAEVVEESTGKRFSVKPVVTFPGWYVDSTPAGRDAEVWVLNPKAIPSFVRNRRSYIPLEDQKLLSYHLARYIRSESEKRRG